MIENQTDNRAGKVVSELTDADIHAASDLDLKNWLNEIKNNNLSVIKPQEFKEVVDRHYQSGTTSLSLMKIQEKIVAELESREE